MGSHLHSNQIHEGPGISLSYLDEERDHSKKAMEHIQTPRKGKPTSLQASQEGWFVQDDDEESMGLPFEKVDPFIQKDPLSREPIKD